VIRQPGPVQEGLAPRPVELGEDVIELSQK
jgi:hypothetical protein